MLQRGKFLLNKICKCKQYKKNTYKHNVKKLNKENKFSQPHQQQKELSHYKQRYHSRYYSRGGPQRPKDMPMWSTLYSFDHFVASCPYKLV